MALVLLPLAAVDVYVLRRSLTPIYLHLGREFASSTILTIAHRLRTVIDYDRVGIPIYARTFTSGSESLTQSGAQVMLLDQGRIVEFDTPATLLSNPQSKFYALCKATGKQEFAVLRKMAGV